MKKFIIIAIALIVLLAVGAVIFFGQKQGTAPLPPVNSGLPAATSTIISNPPSGNIVTLQTSQGAVHINNIFKNPQQVTPDKTSMLVSGTNGYDILYYAPDGSFLISISATPVTTIIAQAESAFLQLLGISKSDACKLKVQVSVPISVDPNYAGQNFGLSFCPGGSVSQ